MALNLSAPFLTRRVASTLLAVALALAGILAFRALPVAALPQVEFPTIAVTATLPGAAPGTVASAVALPLERQFTGIAGITEMTSTSYAGSVRIVLQFDLDRDIDGASRDVQAAINAARSRLPADLAGNPTYRKVNPAEAPVLVLALTSKTASTAQMYDAASTVLQQRLLQTEGVGDVMVGGGSLPAVRVEIDPDKLNHHGLALEDVRRVLASANANGPKGQIDHAGRSAVLGANDALGDAAAFAPLVVRTHDDAQVSLSDLGTVTDNLENLRNWGTVDGETAVAIIISKRPDSNVVATVDRLRAMLPELQASIPADIRLSPVLDRTQTIRASLHDVELTLVISVLLVIAVTWAFFRDWRTTLVPAIAVPLSLLGTFAVMWALGYSLNILSLMALTISTGFVVDDAIVVVENIVRHLGMGKSRVQAALDGAGEVGFTVLSISVSLVAVFIPLLLMGGLVGRLFREFAVTLSAAIVISMIVSLVLTPVMSGMLLRRSNDPQAQGAGENGWYGRSLKVALRHPRTMVGMTVLAMFATLGLMVAIPKGFFPQQDTGLLIGQVLAPQNISFAEMQRRFQAVAEALRRDPDVENVFGFVGGSGVNANNTGAVYITLKALGKPRTASAAAVMDRARERFAKDAGVTVTLQAIQDIAVGGRQTAAQYQYTLSAASQADLDRVVPRVETALRAMPELADVASDRQDRSLGATLQIDRTAAARLHVDVAAIDQALYDAFGQRQVSTMYKALNQYHVVMALAPRYWQSPDALRRIYVPSSQTPAALVPLSAVAAYSTTPAAIALSHQGQSPSVTLSFNLKPDASIGAVRTKITRTVEAMHLPPGVHAGFGGSAGAFADTIRTMPVLLIAALAAVYIVLGILYESFRHPLTVLSTLPSAGAGALLALLLCGYEFTVIALIAIILLIGIVKKNAIMMIDFALVEERVRGLEPGDAIYRASLARLRPILMTTLAAVLGAVPLVFVGGYGAEFRHPLGVAIIGGLLLSQLLTLYSTPAIYLCIERWHRRRAPTDATP
ncbi:multidrug transporter subunit MdtC [Luteibacter jiangsuensis]|uniref:Multidrug transporter subunit MdtC n=1 Tax=Luteibacter jiangsuensis TaxID=637577 RepID=A0ABX0Q0R1_9GAMM|nr:efflux RND transporter permease subunit [Luteibacter jiangsuensis]NID03347.1 multidrug transporter subunit MdtC [Luteibacter jiangsuensis]